MFFLLLQIVILFPKQSVCVKTRHAQNSSGFPCCCCAVHVLLSCSTLFGSRRTTNLLLTLILSQWLITSFAGILLFNLSCTADQEKRSNPSYYVCVIGVCQETSGLCKGTLFPWFIFKACISHIASDLSADKGRLTFKVKRRSSDGRHKHTHKAHAFRASLSTKFHWEHIHNNIHRHFFPCVWFT